MGAKYTTIAASGYNASPPSDDGAQNAANLVTWAKHKTKLGDPIKTLAEAINTALVSAFDYTVRQITSSDSTVAGDHMRCVEIASTVTTAVTVSLGDCATMTSTYRVFIKNSSAISQTIGRVTVGDTIDGAASNLTIPAGSGVMLQANAAANGYLSVGATLPAASQANVDAGTSSAVALVPSNNRISLGTEVASTSGTSIDFTGIPSGTRRITIMFVGVSTSGTSHIIVQTGDAGGIETSGYLSRSANGAGGSVASTAGFIVTGSGYTAASTLHGTIVLSLENSTNFTVVSTSNLSAESLNDMFNAAGSKATSAVLDRVRITTVNGSDTFDAGAINIQYER